MATKSPKTRRETMGILLIAYATAAVLSFYGRLPSAIADFYVAHPYEIYFANFALPMLGLMYLHPRSPLRLAIIPVIAFGVLCYRDTRLRFMTNRTWATMLEGPSYLLFFTAVDALVLRRLYLGTDGKEHSEPLSAQKKNEKMKPVPQDTSGIMSWTAIGWVFRVIFSYRGIGTPRQAPNIPKFSSRNPNYVPSRSAFLLQRGLTSVLFYCLLDFLGHQPQSPPSVFAHSKAFLFPSEWDIGTRISSTVMFWLFLRLNIGMVYNAFSFVAVATFFTTPGDWPPYFGSITNAYTLRKYWSLFWHVGLRNCLSSTANFLAYDVLSFPRGSLLGRYTSIYGTFALSAIIHALVDTTAGIKPSENLVWQLFVMQAVGITIEDFVEWAYHQISGSKARGEGKSGVNQPYLWQKALGFVWVLAWLSWTTPTWSYANMRNAGDPLFSFSPIETFKALRA
ncbi:hypothetical protein M011DRAFT_490496 [Sporormia fimetaria CBS 119925]|uniref:Wax synthase domain-containing protein n=1 Tax=Sporormia fimetaria CBS 119925 TaxID=1340428 RepID=A0A6A6UW78_9PLEO|nr:hypothetical protein M011DRAFT_490496 [Sporormia fimetaria CBS 119925]